MSSLKFERFDNLFKFLPKSKIKAGEGLENGMYPFFTSSSTQSKFINSFNYDDESLIFGTGGNASVHYCHKKFATSTDCFVVTKDDENIDLQYVYYYLKSNIQILEKGFKGAGLKHISKKYISQIKIPLLPLQEQKNIAYHLSQLEELINKREESIELLDELVNSTFLKMFLSTNDKTLLPLGDYIDFMTSGSRGWAQYYNETGALFLRIQNVNNGKLLLDDIVRVDLPNKTEGTRTRVQENDLLMSITADLGRTAVIPKDFEEAYINQHLALLRLKLDLLNPIYLSHYFCTGFAKLQVKKYNKGGAKAGLNFTDIKKINILVPSKPLQDKFAEIITLIEQTKRSYEDSLKEMKNLFGSIAQKVFKGDIDAPGIELIDFKEKEIKMTIKLDEEKLIALIKRGDFDISKYINEYQDYDKIKDMIFKLIEDEKIFQKFDDESKKIILEVK